MRQWAEWGVDFVKVDWHPNDLPTARRMADELRRCGRDIVLSLSNNAPAADAAELLGCAQLCRVTGDIRDEWESVAVIGFDHPAAWRRATGPGRFPDPDMLQIGSIGIPNSPNPSATTVLARTAPSFPPQFCTRASLTVSLEDMNTWVQSVTDWSSFQKKKNDSTDTARNSAKNSKANP